MTEKGRRISRIRHGGACLDATGSVHTFGFPNQVEAQAYHDEIVNDIEGTVESGPTEQSDRWEVVVDVNQ